MHRIYKENPLGKKSALICILVTLETENDFNVLMS